MVKTALSVVTIAMGTSLAAAPPAGAAAVNSLTATATYVTPAEDVGRRIEVKLSARVAAIGSSRVARLCRHDRPLIAQWSRVDGVPAREVSSDTTSKSGRLSGVITLEYGGPDPDEPDRVINGDIPFGGGVWTVTVTAPRTSVLVPTGSAPCQQLTATAQVAIPPATV
jgi:hypothetical protein